MIQKGYGTLCISSCTISTILRPLCDHHDSHRRDNRAPLSMMRAVCRWVVQFVHTVHIGSRASSLSCHFHPIHACALGCFLSALFPVSTSSSSPSSTSSWFLPWCLTRTPWKILLQLRHREHGHFHVTPDTFSLAISALQLSSLQWQNELNKDQDHIETYDEFDHEDAFGRVFFNFIKPCGDLVWISRFWKICCKWRSMVETWETVTTTRSFKQGLWSILVFSRMEKWSYGARSIRKAEKTFLDMMHLSGNAHSAKYGETIHDGSGKPETLNHQAEANSGNFVMGSDAAEFVDRIKDQVRNKQKRMSNVAESGEKHSIIWGMFMAAALNAATFMGKNFSTVQSFVKSSEDFTMKQMFDVTAQLVNNQEEIECLDKILWGKNSWTHLSLTGDETVINFQCTKVYVFSNSELCFGRILQHPNANEAWKNRVAGVQSGRSYRDYDGINGESTQFEWNIFPGFTTLQLCDKKKISWTIWDKHQKFSQTEFFLYQCSLTSLVTKNATKMNVWQMPESSKSLRTNLVLINDHLLDKIPKRSGILQRMVHKEPGIILRKKCSWNLQKADILSCVQRHHCPEENWKVKEKGKYPYTSVLIQIQLIQFIALFFLSISSVSTEQWQLYVKNLRTIKMDRGNLRFWWVNQLFSVKSKQKLESTMKIPETTKSFCSNTFNKLNRFHQKTDWVNFVRKQEEQPPQTSTSVVATKSKAKAKPQPRELVGTTATMPIHERRWIDIEPSEQNLASYEVSKKVSNLLRHNQTLQREKEGAIEFNRIKFYFRNNSSQVQHSFDERWKVCLAAEGGSKRRYQYYLNNSGRILDIRALQWHPGSNIIDILYYKTMW